jgi:hypothetical protein
VGHEILSRVGEARWRELYDETGGSPLALVHTLGLLRIRTALTFDGALTMLRGNRDADLQRFIFQEARRELQPNDQAALGALAFFAPSAMFEAWTDVAALSRNALEAAIDRLSALSLLDVLAGEERYALHSLTRHFVRDELLGDAQIASAMGCALSSIGWPMPSNMVAGVKIIGHSTCSSPSARIWMRRPNGCGKRRQCKATAWATGTRHRC